MSDAINRLADLIKELLADYEDSRWSCGLKWTADKLTPILADLRSEQLRLKEQVGYWGSAAKEAQEFRDRNAALLQVAEAKLSAHEAGLERLRGLHERLAVNDFYAGSAVFAAVEELLGLLAASPTRQQEPPHG